MSRPAWRRRAAGVLLALAVLLLHAWVAQRMGERMRAFDQDAPPPRVKLEYVREMELTQPPPPAAAPVVPVKPRVKPAAPSAAPAPEPAASEPAPPEEVPKPEAAASQPEPPQAAASAAPPMAAASDVVVAGPSLAASAPDGAASAPPFDWPESTRLSYVLTGNYQGEINGSAQVEWVHTGPRYRVYLDVFVGLSVVPLMSRHISSEGEITPDGLAPQRYDERTQIGFSEPRQATIRFERDEVQLANGQRSPRWPGMQDSVSQFVQLSWMFGMHPEQLFVGNSLVMPLALSRSADRWVYDVVGEEMLHTSFGPLAAVHVKPRREVGLGTDLTAEIWFAPALRYLPVRILIHQNATTYVDLLIDRKPQLAAP